MTLLIVTLFIISGTSTAIGYLSKLGSPEVTIKQVFTHRDGEVSLIVSGITLNPDDCGDTGIVHLNGDYPGHDQMVSAALTAFAAGKKIGLYTSGCAIIPFWGGTKTRPIINNLWISY